MDNIDTVTAVGLTTGYKVKGGIRRVTSDINGSLRSGQLTCLLGPNGAGKSTLLKTLIAFLPPVEGEVLIMGKNVSEYTDAELARVIGIVLTERPALTNMTVEELVGLGRSPYTGYWGRLGSADMDIVERSIKLVGISSLKGRNVATLSDGERQKVMIAKALAQKTPVIFLDEPTAFLDYPSKIEMMLLLRRLAREEGKTVFLSTHDLEIALQIADCVWLLDKVHGVTVGTPRQLADDGSLERYFHCDGMVFDAEGCRFMVDPAAGAPC